MLGQTTQETRQINVLAFAPGIVLAGGALALLGTNDTPWTAAVAYLAYAVLAIVLPGLLVVRALWGRSANLLTDVAWGGTVGLMLEMLGWAIFTLLGINSMLWLWPAAIVAAFLAVPGLRTHWRPSAQRTPPLLAWGVTAASLASFAHLTQTYFRNNVPPPSPYAYGVDVAWHIGVAYESIRHVVLRTPESAIEGTLHYHWFSDAHFAAASLISGVDIPTIITRPGNFLLIFLLVASSAALAMRLTSRPSAGAVAALLVVATTAGFPAWNVLHAVRLVNADSPSGIYAAPTSLLIAALAVEVFTGQRLGWRGWVLVGGALLMAVGSKPSVLIVLGPAAACVGLTQLIRTRRVSGQVLALGAAMVGVFGLSIPLFSSSSGSILQPNAFVAAPVTVGSHTLAVLAGILKSFWLAVPAGLALGVRRVRESLAAQLLAWATLAGLVETWVISHPGGSQLFFWSSAMPFAAVLAAWGLTSAVVALPAQSQRRVRGLCVVGAAATVGAMVWARFAANGTQILHYGFIAVAILAVLFVLLHRILRVPFVLTVAIASTLPVALSLPVNLIRDPLLNPAPGASVARMDQTRAALWVKDHVPTDDILATNAHCLGVPQGRWNVALRRSDPLPKSPEQGPTYCDARSFWLSGFGGRVVLLGGYGVSPSQLGLTGGGRPAWWQPYHDPALLALNDEAFTKPSAAGINELYARYGVRWLVANRAEVTKPSATLGTLAEEVYSNNTVSVYRIRPPAS